MPERPDDGKNLIGTNQNPALGQVAHFAGVRCFGETQPPIVTTRWNQIFSAQFRFTDFTSSERKMGIPELIVLRTSRAITRAITPRNCNRKVLNFGHLAVSANLSSRITRFSTFEVNLHTGELRRRGQKVKLQEQPLQVLAALLERPGELVTREELRSKLWPADTFVDFDHSHQEAARCAGRIGGNAHLR
jgi:hypothetical protein